MRERTSVAIEKSIRAAARREAKRRGISVSSLVNEALARHLSVRAPPRRCTVRDLAGVIESHGQLGDEWGDSVLDAIRSQGEVSDPWASS